jgi:uncharacterized protein (DUF3084 family)
MSKLKEEQLLAIAELRKKSQQIQIEIGNIAINEYRIKESKREMFAELKKLDAEAQELMSKISDEYGPGNIDIDTGEFTPLETKE